MSETMSASMSNPKPATLADLVAVMAALRTPVTGCPWDLEQTFATIAPYTIEEAYEVADAIARGDLADLKDELGDLLLQVVYHARIAEEDGAFALPDVVAAVTAKMIRRHPHVFGDAAARSSGAAKDFWETIKAQEKRAKTAERARFGIAPAATPASALDDVPVPLPALTRAIKLQDKAARVGFDWPSIHPVLTKVREEIGELEAEIAQRNSHQSPTPHAGGEPLPLATSPPGSTTAASVANAARIEEEFGDLLFVIANVARHLQIDPESALRAANGKFTRRFRSVEALLRARGKTPAQSDLAEMDTLWDAVKRAEKSG